MDKQRLKPFNGPLHPRSAWKGKYLPPDLVDGKIPTDDVEDLDNSQDDTPPENSLEPRSTTPPEEPEDNGGEKDPQ